MRYHIDTIPLWDAFRAGGECPLCTLEKGLEDSFLDSYLGGSVMEPETRVAVNEEGFCPRHIHSLFAADKKLPVALMMHTHLGTLREKMAPLFSEAAEPAGRRRRNAPDPLDALQDLAASARDACIICRRTGEVMARYVETVLVLWQREEEFRTLFAEGRGFCLGHFAALLREGRRKRPFFNPAPFLAALCDQQQQALERLDEELKGFTRQFDYRSDTTDWGSSRDALPRTILKINGYKADMPT